MWQRDASLFHLRDKVLSGDFRRSGGLKIICFILFPGLGHWLEVKNMFISKSTSLQPGKPAICKSGSLQCLETSWSWLGPGWLAAGGQSSWAETGGQRGLHPGGPDRSYREAESCGLADSCRCSEVFEETEVPHNRSFPPGKVRERRGIVKTAEDREADAGLRQVSHLSTGDRQHFGVREDGGAAMKVHQVLQKPVVPLLPHDDVTAVLHHVDHEMSAAFLSSIAKKEEEKKRWDCMGGNTAKRTPIRSHVPI